MNLLSSWETANVFKGDVNAISMDSAMRTRDSSTSIGIAAVVLYVFHIVTHIVMHLGKVRSKEFNDIERKVYIPLLTVGISYLLHTFDSIDWWCGVMIWFVVVLWVVACIVCMVSSLRKGFCFKLAITLALVMCLIYWTFYWIMQINDT